MRLLYDKRVKLCNTSHPERTRQAINEAQAERKESQDDLFKSGRSIAYFEIKDIIESRLKIYGIEPEQENDE